MKPIPQFKGCYTISKSGKHLFSFLMGKDRTLIINKTGYLRVHLDFMGRRKFYLVHRLVAETFIPNPNNLPQVNHKDGNKLNNHYKNLEWATQVQNSQHSWDNGLQLARLKPIRQTDKLTGEFIKTWDSPTIAVVALKDKYPVGVKNISQAARGRRNSCGGFKWEYLSEQEVEEYKLIRSKTKKDEITNTQ